VGRLQRERAVVHAATAWTQVIWVVCGGAGRSVLDAPQVVVCGSSISTSATNHALKVTRHTSHRTLLFDWRRDRSYCQQTAARDN
jgi:hypothetical protein